jgi:hypothetical protein
MFRFLFDVRTVGVWARAGTQIFDAHTAGSWAGAAAQSSGAGSVGARTQPDPQTSGARATGSEAGAGAHCNADVMHGPREAAPAGVR